MLRGRREDLARRAHQPQPLVLAPDQGLFAQRGQGTGQRVGDRRARVVTVLAVVPAVTGEQPEQRFVRGGVGGHRERLGGLQREPVEVLQRAYDRGTGAYLVASWVMSPGTGLRRSGRASSSPANDSSSRARRASASVRGGVVIPIRPTVVAPDRPEGATVGAGR